MAKGDIVIPISTETKAFRQGVESGIIEPLDDAQKALEDLGRAHGLTDVGDDADRAASQLDDITDAAKDVDRAVDKLGRNDGPEDLERAMKDAQDATENLGDETKRTADAIEKDFRDSYKRVGESGKEGLGRVGEAAGELKSEGFQNLSETVSSFRGDLSDLGQLGQDTLGGLAGSLADMGPAGAAGAIGLGAVAAGVGTITDAFDKATEAADDARAAAFQFAYDVGGALQAAGYSERMAAWTGDTEKFKQAQDIATISGWDVVDVVDAIASGGSKLDDLWRSFEDGAATTTIASKRALALESALGGVKDGYASGTQAAEIGAIALGRYAAATGKATGETDDLGNAIYKLPDNTEVVVNAQTKRAYENVDQFETKVNGVDGRNATVKVHVDDSAVRHWHPPMQIGATTLQVNPVLSKFNFGRYIP